MLSVRLSDVVIVPIEVPPVDVAVDDPFKLAIHLNLSGVLLLLLIGSGLCLPVCEGVKLFDPFLFLLLLLLLFVLVLRCFFWNEQDLSPCPDLFRYIVARLTFADF